MALGGHGLLDLVGKVYDAAVDSSLWPAFLELFSDAVAASATLVYHDMVALQGSIASSVRIDPQSETLYNLHYSGSDPWRQSFGLTPAEANLASILMTGKSLEEATDQLAISMNTAKTQLKAIFSKTETSGQGEIIRLLPLSVAQVDRPNRES